MSFIHILKTDLSNANISECKLKSWELKEVLLTNSAFFKTSLRGVDFTESEITGIILSNNYAELQGAIVNVLQAAELAKFLGVVVK